MSNRYPRERRPTVPLRWPGQGRPRPQRNILLTKGLAGGSAKTVPLNVGGFGRGQMRGGGGPGVSPGASLAAQLTPLPPAALERGGPPVLPGTTTGGFPIAQPTPGAFPISGEPGVMGIDPNTGVPYNDNTAAKAGLRSLDTPPPGLYPIDSMTLALLRRRLGSLL